MYEHRKAAQELLLGLKILSSLRESLQGILVPPY